MRRDWGMPESDLLTGPELEAVECLRDVTGFDTLAQPLFWECAVARRLGGIVTRHKALHDVEVTIWDRVCLGEVKYSTAFFSTYKPIRGKNWSRHTFKWALPRGNSGKAGVDAVVFIGRDVDGLLFCWVVPASEIAADCKSITVAAPSARTIGTWSAWDRWQAPMDAVLPAFARACHNRYDQPHRRKNAAKTRRDGKRTGELFT